MAETPESLNIGRAIDAILDDDRTSHLVDIYFEGGKFAGVDFDTLAPSDPDRFEPADLLAVNLLDVRMGPRGIRDLLSGRFDPLVAVVDQDVDLWDERAAEGTDLRRHMNELYFAIRGVDGVGPTTASKLLARKRPRLLPIRDSVIDEQLDVGTSFWSPLADALRVVTRRHRIERLAPGVEVSTLRRLDVAVWMTGSRSRNAKSARLEAAKRAAS